MAQRRHEGHIIGRSVFTLGVSLQLMITVFILKVVGIGMIVKFMVTLLILWQFDLFEYVPRLFRKVVHAVGIRCRYFCFCHLGCHAFAYTQGLFVSLQNVASRKL